MPLIIEDGTGVVGANSYGTLDEADDYMADHPYYSSTWADLSWQKKESLLTYAASYMDSLFAWNGYRVYEEQVLGWPRQSVTTYDHILLSSTSIPLKVKQAQFEIALSLSREDPFQEQGSFGLEELEIDVIKLKFDKTQFKDPVPAAALLLLRGLGRYLAGQRVIRAEPS